MIVYDKLSHIQRLITTELVENDILYTHVRFNVMLSVTQSDVMYLNFKDECDIYTLFSTQHILHLS
jgi:hypothetical protein